MAGTIVYLASRAGGYAYGQEIVIDGGYTSVNPSRAWVQIPDICTSSVKLTILWNQNLCHRITNKNLQPVNVYLVESNLLYGRIAHNNFADDL